jgi:A/G-specific adenine glycosylase
LKHSKQKFNPEKIRRHLGEWFENFGRDLPWRRTTDPYAIMVSEFMLQQTQVAAVIPYFTGWITRFPRFATLAEASEPEVLAMWQGLGYYARARNLHRAAKEVVSRHGGQLPSEVDSISSLPGVGRYTAGAIASFAFDLPVPAVDANIARVLARLIDLQVPVDSASGSHALWRTAEALLPVATGGRLHTSALMELGALICVPRQPKCVLCPISDHCQAQRPEELPRKKPRRATVAITENCMWLQTSDRIFLTEQTGTRWKGLWKLPEIEAPIDTSPLLTMEYPFTHHRVTLRVFAAPDSSVIREDPADGRWIIVTDLDATPLAAPHKRAIQQLLTLRD